MNTLFKVMNTEVDPEFSEAMLDETDRVLGLDFWENANAVFDFDAMYSMGNYL